MEEMKDIAKFNLKYDGKALKDHAIDIDVLCPSLESLSKLVKKSNRIIYTDSPEISVKVNANTEQNCFELLLHLGFLGFFNTEAMDISTILSQYFSLVKALKGRPSEKPPTRKHGGNVEVAGHNNKFLVVNGDVYGDVYFHQNILINTKKFLTPLEKEGIDNIVVGEKNNSTSFDKTDFEELKKNLQNEKISSEETEEILSLPYEVPILNINTKTWSFLLYGELLKIDISGTGIAENVEKRGRFHLGDEYKVMLEKTTYQTPTGRRITDYKITKILKFPNDK